MEHDGYVPQGIGISDDSDAVEFKYCVDCGQIQNEFPIKFSGKFDDDGGFWIDDEDDE